MGRFVLSRIVSCSLAAAFVLMLVAWGWSSSMAQVRPLVAFAITLLVCLKLLLIDAPIRICPRCGSESLHRRAISPFGYRYFECESCGVRAKRKSFQDWKDASGPSDDKRFRQRSRSKSDAVPVDQTGNLYAGSMSGMQGRLLANKRQRSRLDDQSSLPEEPPPHDP